MHNIDPLGLASTQNSGGWARPPACSFGGISGTNGWWWIETFYPQDGTAYTKVLGQYDPHHPSPEPQECRQGMSGWEYASKMYEMAGYTFAAASVMVKFEPFYAPELAIPFTAAAIGFGVESVLMSDSPDPYWETFSLAVEAMFHERQGSVIWNGWEYMLTIFPGPPQSPVAGPSVPMPPPPPLTQDPCPSDNNGTLHICITQARRSGGAARKSSSDRLSE